MRCALRKVNGIAVSVRKCNSLADNVNRNKSLNESPAAHIASKHNIAIERVSLSRGLALNRFEKDFFIYPEYTDTDAATSALQLSSSLSEDIKRAVTNKQSIGTAVWDKYRLSSYTVPKKYGGIDMCYKDLLTVCEGLGSAWSLFNRFEQTHLVASLILLYGSEEQKTHFLPQIASGAIRPAVCFSESQIFSNFDSVTAVCETINGQQKLTAVKQHILNVSDSNLFLIFAKQDEDNLTCYLVDRGNKNNDAFKMKTKKSVFGSSELEVHTLDSTEIILEPGSMLGSPEDGVKILQKASSKEIVFGTAVVGFLKTLISSLCQYCNTTLLKNLQLAKKDAIKHLVTKLALDTYVLESMCYYVGGLYDEELVLLVDIEEAVIHKHARELLSKILMSTVDVVGRNVVTSDMSIDGILNEIIAALLLSATDLDLDGFVASKIITSYAKANANRLKHWRLFDGQLFDRVFGQAEKALAFDDPKLKHFIAEHAHPSLKEACINLEHTMWRLEALLDSLICRHGKCVLSDYNILCALSKVAQCNLGMVATIARSSRSYSIGLRNADLEVSWTQLYCSEAANISLAELRKLHSYFRNERLNPLYAKIGEAVLDAGGYNIESPVTRNW